MSDAILPLGFLPLVDAAPLIVAAEMGFDRAEGLSFDLRRAHSWSSLRDMVAFGQVMAAQMLSPMPVATALGLGGGGVPLAAVSVLSTNGEVIGVSRDLAARMRDAGHHFGFHDAAAAGQALVAASQVPLRIGVPFPFSMHAELLYYWLTASGLPAPASLDIRTVPPHLMASALAAGDLDAFCVGEPWGSMAVEDGAGALLLPGSAIWLGAPEKVLGVRADLADTAPDVLRGCLRSLWHAGRWLSDPSNRTTACALLAGSAFLDVPGEIIDRALSGQMIISDRGDSRMASGFMDFARMTPQTDHAGWIADRLAARLGLDRQVAETAGRGTFRPDFHGASLGAIPGYQADTADRSRFFDGQVFSPSLSK